MEFGGVTSVKSLDLSLPPDDPATARILSRNRRKGAPRIHIGCAKWNRQDLKNFYPRGTKDELPYYATQFNSIELNASFYRQFPPEQFRAWAQKVPDGFKFFPKVVQEVSHWKRLQDASAPTAAFIEAIRALGDRLGLPFLQLKEDFHPRFFDRLEPFLQDWPHDIPLAIEFRHTDWYNDPAVSSRLYPLLEKYRVLNVITDTAGRRDLIHMRLTTPSAFIRYVGANHRTDRDRLEEWVWRVKDWIGIGIDEIHFFVHQNKEEESPALAAHFIKGLNTALGMDLRVPDVVK